MQSWSSVSWKEVTETIDPEPSQRWTAKSHEAMDMRVETEENPDQIYRIKSFHWECCSPGMRTQSLWGIYTLEDFHSWTWPCMACGATDLQASFLIYYFPLLLIHSSLILCHASLTHGLIFPWPFQRQCFLMHCCTQVQSLFLLDGNLQCCLIPSLQLPQFIENLLLGFCSRQV